MCFLTPPPHPVRHAHCSPATSVFAWEKTFDQNIGPWDVSRVTDMKGMFYEAWEFNQDLSAWNVSSVTTMADMFFNAHAFSQTLCGAAWVTTSAAGRPGLVSRTLCSCTFGAFFEYGSGGREPNCHACPAGYYQGVRVFKSDACTQCPNGTHTVPVGDAGATAADACVVCAPGTFMTAAANVAPGAFRMPACTTCPAGQFQPEIPPALNATDVSLCRTCAPGRFVDDHQVDPAAHVACADCPAGTFSNLSGLNRSCPVCGGGRIAPSAGMTACVNCETNTYNGFGTADGDRDKHDSDDDCVACPEGQFTFGQEASLFCSPCPAGTRTAKQADVAAHNRPQSRQCIPCAPGYFQADAASDTCKACQEGQYQPDEAKPFCLPCVPGKANNRAGQPRCQPCPRNTYTNVLEATACVACEAGTKTAGIGSAVCQRCAAGEYSLGSTCRACPQGWYRGGRDEDASRCLHCPTGQETYGSGAAECTFCALGTYGDQQGHCAACSQGLFQDGKGAVQCKRCLDDRVPNEDGTACEPAPWKTASSCDPAKEYLRDDCTVSTRKSAKETEATKMQWACAPCPPGAECNIDSVWTRLDPEPGWWRVPAELEPYERRPFQRCLFPQDCDVLQYGGSRQDGEYCGDAAVNGTEMTSTVVTTTTHNSSDGNSSSERQADGVDGNGCRPGTTGVLCSQCAVGFDRTAAVCRKCVESEVPLRVTMLVLLILFVLWLIWRARSRLSNLHRRYRHRVNDALQALRIIVSFGQICMSMPGMLSGAFTFPDVYMNFLRVWTWVEIDLAALVGAQCLVRVDFRYSVLVSACLPPTVLFIGFVVYQCYGRISAYAYARRVDREATRRNLSPVRAASRRLLVTEDNTGKKNTARGVDSTESDTSDTTSGRGGTDSENDGGSDSDGGSGTQSATEHSRIKTMGLLFDLCDDDSSRSIDAKELLYLVRSCNREQRHKFDLPMAETTLQRILAGARNSGGSTRRPAAGNAGLSRDAFIAATAPAAPLYNLLPLRKAAHWMRLQRTLSSCLAVSLQVLLFLHAPVSARGFSYFDCHRIGQHAMASFLRRDYAIRCASAEYYAFVPVAVILLLGFAAGLPLSLLGFLVSHRRELHTPTTKLRMGFLYRHLRNGVEWWDIQGG